MSDVRRVMPREALKAERVTTYLGESWSLGFHRTLFTDEEFDAAYIDADLVQAVLDAADAWQRGGDAYDIEELDIAVCSLRADPEDTSDVTLPAPTPAPGPGEPTLVREVDPDGVTELIKVWWDGTSLEHIAWVEIIFGARNFRMTGERKVMRKARPQTLGGVVEFEAPAWEPDPGTLEIRGVGDAGGEEWKPVPIGVWLCGRRPYQPPVRVRIDQVIDPALARTVKAVEAGQADVTMTIERKPEPPNPAN